MKIFITGLLGFVGQNLAHHLAKQGHDLVGLIHDFSPRSLETLRWEPPITKIHGDVRDFKRIREILYDYRPDAIVHLAAQAIVRQAHDNPYTTYEVNTGGTATMLAAWQTALPNAHFLHFSTDKVYAEGLGKKETDPVYASGIYETSKAAADLIAQSYLPQITVTRSVNIYGPGDKNSRIIPNTIQTCLTGRNPVAYKSEGHREYIYVDDLSRIVTWLLEGRRLGVWNIGSGILKNNQEVVAEVLKHFPDLTMQLEDKMALPQLQDQSLNCDKLCAEMDCVAFTTFPAGIKATVDWWKEQTEPLIVTVPS